MPTYTWAAKKERQQELSRLGEALLAHQEQLYALENDEVGLTRGLFKSAEGFIQALRHISGHELALLEGREPLGRVAIVLPYNFSLGAFLVSGVHAYLAGNAVAVKFSSKAPRTSAFMGALISEHLHDFSYTYDPERTFITAHLQDPETRAIQVFGHDNWGERYLDQVRETGTKWVFEGPGKDPFIVFADADVPRAARMAVYHFFLNSGQACASAERCYVQKDIYDAFLRHLMAEVEQVYTDDYQPEAETLGFLGSDRVAHRLQGQLQGALDIGARLLIGGQVHEHQWRGTSRYYAQGTVLTNVTHDMEIMREETFAPVIPIQTFATEAEALQLANDSKYGLTASVFGGSLAFLRQIRHTHGLIFENDTLVNAVKRFTLSTPWGGFKRSAWVWEWDGVHFCRREGPRLLLREFSTPQQRFCPHCQRFGERAGAPRGRRSASR